MSGFISESFPLHDAGCLADFRKNWALNPRMHPIGFGSFKGEPQPLLKIRNYFGEKIALYFAWLENYTNELIAPSIAGLAVQWLPPNGAVLIVFGCLVSIWSSLMTEKWKTVNGVLNLEWGMRNFEKDEVERPEFTGTLRYSPVTDLPEMHHVAPREFKRRLRMSQLAVMGMCSVACVATYACLMSKSILSEPKHGLGERGIQLAGLINAFQVIVGNILFGGVATLLTDWENHRTQTEWERRLITKTFLFRFM